MRKGWLFPLITLVVASMACQTILNPITNTGTEVSELEPESLLESLATAPIGDSGTQGEALLRDDFDDPSSGWEVGDYDAGSVGYTSDAYSVISLGDNDAMWGLAYREFDDVVIEVETEQVRAPANDNNGYGVMCRVQENGDGYLLSISGDGFYSITKWSNDELVPLVDWTTSDVISTGNSTNQIRAICDGPALTLEVNGQQLASTQDSEFSMGDLALTATSFEAEPTEVHFDNLVVSVP